MSTTVIHLAAQSPDSRRQSAPLRGPDSTGVSPTADPPLERSEPRNLECKVEIFVRGTTHPFAIGGS